MLTELNFSVCMMRSKQNIIVLTTFLLAVICSSSLMAAGKCSVIRTESTFELINAPVEEMQNSRNDSAINCVIIKDFISRSKMKPGSLSNPAPTTPPSSTTAGAYAPKTKDDNTPWRFDMNQNGKRMTSEQFDAWMKSKGIHVATGKPGGPDAVVVKAEPAPECKPTKKKKC
jgi:hypothetical protein